MNDAILTALITGGLSLIGVVITCLATARRNENNLRISQAITDTKLEELTRRMPVVEEQINVINHRLTDLETFRRPHS